MAVVEFRQPERPIEVETDVFRLVNAILRDTHENRGISVIKGPPGIGKTTALNAYLRETEGCGVTVVKISQGGHKTGARLASVMKQCIRAYTGETQESWHNPLPDSTWRLQERLWQTIAQHYRGWENEWPAQMETFIFDEAQYLSREAIEELRFWNDPDRCKLPFPVGLVFIGNDEFALAASRGRESVITDAVRSRLLHEEHLTRANVSDEDLRAVIQHCGVGDKAAQKMLFDLGAKPPFNRDLRRMANLIKRLNSYAADGPITADIVQLALT